MDESLGSLAGLTSRLRRECPWDREQTFRTIATYLLEETHEVLDAIDEGHEDELAGELGDLLFQICFLAEMAAEKGWFDLNDVVAEISRKMVERHPHVFTDQKAASADEVRANWEKRKRASGQPAEDPLSGIPRGLPALAAAQRMSSRAADLGFDWERDEDLLEKVSEEIGETKEALAAGSPALVEEELGDLLFTLANWGRRRGIDSEQALRKANSKFRRRFARVAAMSRADGKDVSERTAAELDAYWEKVKAGEETGSG